MTAGLQVAQFNWGELKADWDDPSVAEFVDNIDRVNALAERFPGFVWRLSDEEMETQQTSEKSPIDWADNNRVASTLSVWDSTETLRSFVYSGVHGHFYRKGGNWLVGVSGWPRLVLWRVPFGHRPTVAEGVSRLKHLRANGPSDHAFGLDLVEGHG